MLWEQSLLSRNSFQIGRNKCCKSWISVFTMSELHESRAIHIFDIRVPDPTHHPNVSSKHEAVLLVQSGPLYILPKSWFYRCFQCFFRFAKICCGVNSHFSVWNTILIWCFYPTWMHPPTMMSTLVSEVWECLAESFSTDISIRGGSESASLHKSFLQTFPSKV